MRKFLSSTVGATFHSDRPNHTFCVRKDSIELIGKLRPGVYAVIHLLRATDDKGLVFADWGTYFDRIKNPQVQLPQIKRCNPTLYEVLQVNEKSSIYQVTVGMSDGSKHRGFALPVAMDKKSPLLNSLTKEVSDAAFDLIDKCAKIYNELHDNPPFPAWKPGLNEVWNR